MSTALISADHYLATPDDRPRWTELIDGEVHIMNGPAVRHQRIVAFLMRRIGSWVEGAEDRGECPASLDCRLDDGTVLAPDVLWLSAARVARLTETYLDGPPDLAVEVRSPSTWQRDIGAKKRKYEESGLPELWLVDTSSDTVMVFRRTTGSPEFDVAMELGADDELTTQLMPGLTVRIRELFDR